MKLGAHLSHYALYALMITLPLIGWSMLSAAGYPVVLWGGLWLPPIAPQSDSLHTLLWHAHVYLALLFFAVILLHVAAALFHALVRRDDVFEAMGPDADTRGGRRASAGGIVHFCIWADPARMPTIARGAHSSPIIRRARAGAMKNNRAETP